MTIAYISTSLGSMNVSTPWAGVVGNSHRVNSGPSVADTYLNQKSKKSQLHEHLAGENIGKPSERESARSKIRAHVLVLPVTGSQSDSIDDGNFIDANESKKSRKRLQKLKLQEPRWINRRGLP